MSFRLVHPSFRLRKEAGKVNVVPKPPKELKENTLRKGFFERERFVSLRAALAAEIKAHRHVCVLDIKSFMLGPFNRH